MHDAEAVDDDDELEDGFDYMRVTMEIILLNAQPDFAAQKEWLEDTVESSGHEIIFLPKFHPELSFIEMMWEFVKTQLRRSCTFTPIYMLFPQAL